MKPQNIFVIIGAVAVASIIFNEYQRRRNDAPVYLRKSLASNYNARTIPPFGIFIKESEKDNQALLEHELVHWQQYQEKGLINYYKQYAKELKLFGYDKMPMEKEARKEETEYCKDNYTDCVRNGTSKTVYNPNFRQ